MISQIEKSGQFNNAEYNQLNSEEVKVNEFNKINNTTNTLASTQNYYINKYFTKINVVT